MDHASWFAMDEFKLTEHDVPGACLSSDRDLATLTIPILKRLLECRGVTRKGTKQELVAR